MRPILVTSRMPRMNNRGLKKSSFFKEVEEYKLED